MRGGVGTPCKCAAACRGALTRSTVEHLVPKDLSLVLSFCSMVSGGVHSGQHCPASTASHSGL